MKSLATSLWVSIVLVLTGCEEGANSQHPTVQYEEKKKSLADMERESPLKFLKIKGAHRRNLLNQTVVEGEIQNLATLVGYKKIEIVVVFRDKEGNVLEKQKHVLDEEAEPESTLEFKVKTSHVKHAATTDVDIISAVAIAE